MFQEHDLKEVVLFSGKHHKMVENPAGGWVLDHTLFAQPDPTDPDTYWRYYCSCGQAGGRAGSEQNAMAGFTRHKKEHERYEPQAP